MAQSTIAVDKITPEERNRRRLTIPPKYNNLDRPYIENLWNAYQVDQAIMDEPNRLVVIRFGSHDDVECQVQDHALLKVAKQCHEFAVFYKCDNRYPDHVYDFNQMYELYDKSTVMFFFRNKHMMCDFGTGNNNKINWVLEDVEDLIMIVTLIYQGAKKGRGLVTIPKDYSTSHAY